MRSPLLLISLLGLLSLPTLHAQREKLPPQDLELVEQKWPQAKKTNSGIRYIIQREGQGESPKPGDTVSVLYVGQLLDGKVFDQYQDREQPFTFRIAREQVIQGWDQVLQLMKRGEKRLVIIPPELAYGFRGQPPKIPRSATLVFEIDLLDFKRD
ncbi:MAG: FKBP-type peptidyl-prolyl cis-trans isomerase [Opitutaceae bacterium]